MRNDGVVTQPSLFDRPHRAPSNSTDTSRAAARSIEGISGRLRRQVFEMIKWRGEQGATNEELVTLTGISLQTICARANELFKVGLIEDSGERRLTASGRTAKVWRAR